MDFRIADTGAPAGGAANAPRVNSSPQVVVEAVRSVLRGGKMSELPAHGINVVFDGGVVAICRSCHISWEVSRRHLTNLAWWSCPRGCRPQAEIGG